jgi:hypothetical protein
MNRHKQTEHLNQECGIRLARFKIKKAAAPLKHEIRKQPALYGGIWYGPSGCIRTGL